jgi:hypothetical protein
MVTGWNEWVAGRWGNPNGPIEFVDQYDHEFSRDIEPMKGGHGDNYYYQLVANVRRFKGSAPLPRASRTKSIKIDGEFSQWKAVAPEFLDDAGDTDPRDHDGTGGTHYVNRTGRNDLVGFKVASDTQSISFYARTREMLSPLTGGSSMWLLIDVDHNPATGWEGFDCIVNRSFENDRLTWLEQNAGGWTWKRIAPVPFRVAGNELHLTIPRSALQLATTPPALTIDFKWIDNPQHAGDIMDAYLSGDVAPEGRFRFRFTAATE